MESLNKNVSPNMPGQKLEHDKLFSSFGWRILVNKEFDKRMIKNGDLVFDGFSKFRGQNEYINKNQLLLNCVSSLNDKGWFQKSDGIIFYQGCPFVSPDLKKHKPIFWFIRKNGKFCLVINNWQPSEMQKSYLERVLLENKKLSDASTEVIIQRKEPILIKL